MDRKSSRAHPSGYEHSQKWEVLRAFRHQVYTLFGCRRDALFEVLDAVLSAPNTRNAGAPEPGAELPAWLGQPLRCAQRRNHGPGAPRSGSWPRIRWRAADRPGMPSTRACGRAATRKPALSAATTTIPIGIPMASRSWPAGTTPGWCRCRSGARVGRRHCGCGACGRGRTSTWWRPSRSAPGWGRRRPLPAGRSRAHLHASTLAMTPSSSAWPWPTAGLPAGALARGPLLLRRPHLSPHGATAAAWGQVCL